MTAGLDPLWRCVVLNFNQKSAPVVETTASGISGLQVAPTKDNELAKVTAKCAIAGIAVAGFAVAGWDHCDCYSDTWDTTENDPYLISHGGCENE